MNSIVFLRRSMFYDIFAVFLTSVVLFILLIGNIFIVYKIKNSSLSLRRQITEINKKIKIESSILSNLETKIFLNVHPSKISNHEQLKVATVSQYYSVDQVFQPR